jgi:C-terminal processing protease CtpA/Prc
MWKVVGGPAYNTRALDKGDVILEVDAMSIDIESLHDALVGSDVPGSTVTLRVKKAGSGDMKDVEVVRVESRELADKRRLFELFTDIENYIGEWPV